MEYQGKFSHNVVRKVRWANYPFVPGIRENIKTDWADKRLDAWVKTCTQCHSERFARAYLEFMDNGTYSGLDKYDEAHDVVHKQYEARSPHRSEDQPTRASSAGPGRVRAILPDLLVEGQQPCSDRAQALRNG